MVLGGDRSPGRESLEQSLGKPATGYHLAKQCQPAPAPQQQVRIQRSDTKPRRKLGRHYLQGRAKLLSGQFQNTAGSPRRLCGSGAQAVRRICPGRVNLLTSKASPDSSCPRKRASSNHRPFKQFAPACTGFPAFAGNDEAECNGARVPPTPPRSPGAGPARAAVPRGGGARAGGSGGRGKDRSPALC